MVILFTVSPVLHITIFNFINDHILDRFPQSKDQKYIILFRYIQFLTKFFAFY